MTIADLNPKRVWKHFYTLTQIPRPSGHEEKIKAFMKKFGEDLGLETIVDEAGNVIIRKPATPGMEGCAGIILQSHLDMVPQKNNDKVHDFEKDPIEPRIVGEWVYATGTTLGADNGLGIAATMAVLEANDLAHGPVEGLFTAEEETGMTGARALKGGLLKGDILVNLDSEDEGELYVGCAGGLDGSFEFSYTQEAVPGNMAPYSLNITGLKGGHSGLEIHLYRGNANKVITRLLLPLLTKYGVRVASITGGSLRNAIPREAFAKILIPKEQIKAVEAEVKAITAVAKAELSIADPDLQVALVADSDVPPFVIDAPTALAAVRAVFAAFNGVYRMSDSMPGLVETSSNLGIVASKEGKIAIICLIRSSVDSAKDELAQVLGATFELAGASVEFAGGYAGWKPNMDSPILKEMKKVYKNLYGVEPEVKAIHAGLECGILGGNYPHWDMISCGPTLRSPHSPDERALIPTVEKWWNFLVEVLKNAPKR
ncbi:MAG: aminoacyl-histidine dipeptidase [Bacteroidales bacterium]|nr:aminoacyl-histidine dipeptidase [Bacteroidales bacterium]MCL2738474.1 aminoacyl-histidine dipeptidase [Bacteroidales bacterium]